MTVKTNQQGGGRPAPQIGIAVWLKAIVAMVAMPMFTMVAAGDWTWFWGWLLVAYYALTFAVSRGLVALKHPDLITERGTYAEKEDAHPADRRLVTLATLLLPLAGFVVAGLDERFGWSPAIPLWLRLAAVALMLAGAALGTWAMLANRFFSAVVRVQPERGHTVVEDGPYRLVRHPGYLGSVLAYAGLPLMLGSLWAYGPVLAALGLLLYRLIYEDRFLHENLPGYAAYARRTRDRLLPGVW